MNTKDKAHILAQLWVDYRQEMNDDPTWFEFLNYYDVSLPLAYMYAYHVVEEEPTDMGTIYINEAWETLCEMLVINSEGTYKDLGEVFASSPNDPLYGQITVKEVE
jgi:hypothetical protein